LGAQGRNAISTYSGLGAAMNLEEMSNIMKETLGVRDNIVGVALFKREDDIPKEIEIYEKPFRYCQMVQTARLKGDSFLAHADYHECKGGAAGLGLMDCPENIASGSLYFDKLHKCESKEIGASISASMPSLPSGSVVATYVAPLDKMVINPDAVIFVGNALQARRITQAVMYKKGGRSTFDTAGIQSFCVDATASPIFKGEVNISLGCDGAARNADLDDNSVVVGIPFSMMGDICKVLIEHYQDWESFMRGWQQAVKKEAARS
jgi:uncharacterized protein (DUF169 family)